MKDIIQAIEIEKEYIQNRLNDLEPYNLLDKVKECGFNTLDDYFSSKKDYELKHLKYEVIDTISIRGAGLTKQFFLENKPCLIYGDTSHTYVFHGTEYYNKEFCEENSIEVIDYYADGGTIVISDGDLSLGISIPVTDVTSQWILEGLKEIISKYEKDVIVDGNDILVNNKKVVGSASFHGEKGVGFVAHISFSDKTDLIKEICDTYNPIKKPGFLQNVTRQQLRDEVAKWLL